MDATLTLPRPAVAPLPPAESHADALLDALRTAVTTPGEHRLYRSGKLAGLFGPRAGATADAALSALAEGYLETVRTEEKGKWLVEWVRVTPKGVEFVHGHDSPQAVLRELRHVLGQTRAGVPVWMADARHTLDAVTARFDRHSAAMLERLDQLTERVDAALRRVDLDAARRPDPTAGLVPWAGDALAYLDRRTRAGAGGACPLGELFHALTRRTDLTMTAYHAGLVRLHEARALQLTPTSGLPTDVPTDAEYALVHGPALYAFARR